MKKRITALALAVVMVLGTVALAAEATKSIEVVPGINLTVNGQKVTATNSAGQAIDVFATDGATYLPLRFLAEMLGMKVDWNQNTMTANVETNVPAWDGEYDVVVVGFGGAGASSAITAAENGANVLLLEKAPEGEEGGNTRVCGQIVAYGKGDPETTYTYYRSLNGAHDVPEAALRSFTNAIANSDEILSHLTGVAREDLYMNPTGKAEYPELPGAETITTIRLHAGMGDSYLWQQLRKNVMSKLDHIDVWYASPATHLIQDPVTKTVVGVTIERDGEEINIRAKNGVVLACGGFENNREMLENYLGMTDSNPIGNVYNTGDGIRMAQEVGARLWHMDAWESLSQSTTILLPDGENCWNGADSMRALKGQFIYVDGDGNRYMWENEKTRHGHSKLTDTWHHPLRPNRSYLICTEAEYQNMLARNFPENAVEVKSADSITALAALININPEALKKTVDTFNQYAKEGVDPEYGRPADTMEPITGNKFYGIAIAADMLNTQGGPERNENSQVLDTNGNVIPNLYSAGELGGITAALYQAGGNVAETMISGSAAGKNAAQPKAELPAYKTSGTLKYTKGVVNDAVKETNITLGAGEYLGIGSGGMGGEVYVKVTVEGGKITAVEIVDHHETPGIGDRAIFALPEVIVKANSTDVDGISGATLTSNAIKAAVTDALSQVK